MAADTPAELLRTDCAEAVLTILYQLQRQQDWIANIRDFPFVEHPGSEKLEKALKLLYYLGAISSTERTELTPQGERMAKMSTSPRISAILFEGQRRGVQNILSVALGMSTYVGNMFRRGKTEEEKERSKLSRTSFSSDFPGLGDVGVAISVWLRAREQDKSSLRRWCIDNFLNFRVVLDAQKAVRSMLQDMMATSPPPTTTSVGEGISASSASSSGGRRGGGEEKIRAEFDVNGTLRALSNASFSDEVTCPQMLQSFLAGYFANLAFYVPPRADDADGSPAYFLPGPNQMGFLSSAAAFRVSGTFPEVAIYMEIVENRRLYISSLLGVDLHTYEALLPPAFKESEEFATFKKINSRKQMLSRPSVVTTSCPLALKRLFGHASGGKAKQMIEQFRAEFGMSADSELAIDVDLRRSQLLVMCTSDDIRERIASKLRESLADIQSQLERRTLEWALPGMGYVMGNYKSSLRIY